MLWEKCLSTSTAHAGEDMLSADGSGGQGACEPGNDVLNPSIMKSLVGYKKINQREITEDGRSFGIPLQRCRQKMRSG